MTRLGARAAWAAAVWVSLSGAPASAATGVCRPLAALPTHAVLTFERLQAAVPQLTASLARDVLLERDAALSAALGNATSTVLTRDVLVAPQALALEAVNADGLLVVPGEGEAEALAKVGDRHVRVAFRGGKALTADSGVLEVDPVVVRSAAFVVMQGSKISLDASRRVLVSAGAKLRWQADAGSSLAVELRRAARLEEVAPSDAPMEVALIGPSRAVAGATLRLKISAPGRDWRQHPPSFCFAAETGEQKTYHPGNSKWLSNESESALFEVKVPDAMVSANATSVDGVRRWLFGSDALIQVVSVQGDRVAHLSQAYFTLANSRIAALAGVVVLLFFLVLAALFSGRRNPLAMFGELIRHSSGRYSLSNLQILLWTLLVIFALSYAWISTGELPTISYGVLVMLGISGTSSVLARAIEPAPTGEPTKTPMLMDLLSNEDGRGFDLLRFQMLGFTVFTWLYSLASVLRSEGLPDIPENLYVLMGVSNAAYLGGKLPKSGATAPVDPAMGATAEELALTEVQIRDLQARLGAPTTGRIDGTTRAAVSRYQAEHGLLPADGRLTSLLTEHVRSSA